MTNTPDEKSTAIEEDELARLLVDSEQTSEAEPPVVTASDDIADAPAEASEEASEEAPEAQSTSVVASPPERKGIDGARLLAFGVLPALALILALAAGWLKYLDNEASDTLTARIESVQAAKDGTATLLSYQPDKVEQQLTDARKLLTGGFRDDYTDLTTHVVIPGAQQKQISAVATVQKAASVSADPKKAVVLVFVDQTVVIGADQPSATSSNVRVELEKVDGKWLISKFDPV